jgi:microcystin-dependent protein
MLVTNQTASAIYFGPLRLGPGVGTTLTIDDTSATSLYLTNDAVADAVNNAYNSHQIQVTGQAQPFPRPTGIPQLLHGDGNPEGLVFAPQGSIYMRRDGVLSNGGVIYQHTKGITDPTGWLDISTAAGVVVASPPGILLAYGGAAAPSGWLICDGSAVSRSLYSLLFGAIGTNYGVGDGSTTFNIPDLRGRVPVGYAPSGGHSDVSTLGLNDSVALANRRPKHRHTPHTHGVQEGNLGWSTAMTAGGSNLQSNVTTTSADGGSGNANDSLDAPAYLVMNFIIKT